MAWYYGKPPVHPWHKRLRVASGTSGLGADVAGDEADIGVGGAAS